MPPQSDSERELEQLAAELRRLEGEYTKYFAGRSPRPPVELRAHVDRLFRQWDRRQGDSSAARFRLQSLQARYGTFAELWERAQRARDEGRAGPLTRRGASSTDEVPAPKLRDETYAAVLREPAAERDQVRSLYEAVMEARQQTGHEVVPFAQFEELVTRQVAALRSKGASNVVFRVTVTDGRPNLTAKGVKAKDGRAEDEAGS